VRTLPKELRKLGFSEDELRAAAFDYCLRTNLAIPQAPLEALEVGDDPEATVTLKFDTMHTADEKEVKLSRDQVGAALIRFCSDHKIPLPRHGQKVLQVQNGEISLMVNIHWTSDKKKE